MRASFAPWRRTIEQNWPKVNLRLVDPLPAQINAGQRLSLRVAAFLNGLAPDDVLVECLVGVDDDNGNFVTRDRQVFTAESATSGHDTLFLPPRPRTAPVRRAILGGADVPVPPGAGTPLRDGVDVVVVK